MPTEMGKRETFSNGVNIASGHRAMDKYQLFQHGRGRQDHFSRYMHALEGVAAVADVSCCRSIDDVRWRGTIKMDRVPEHVHLPGLRYPLAYSNPDSRTLFALQNADGLHGSVGAGLRSSYGIPQNSSLSLKSSDALLRSTSGASSFKRLPRDHEECDDSDEWQRPFGGFIPTWRLACSGLIVGFGGLLLCGAGERKDGSERVWVLVVSAGCYVGGALFGLAPWGKVNSRGQHYCGDKGWFHSRNTVSHKYLLTAYHLCNTVMTVQREAAMANILSTDKQIAVIGALAEGSSIRSIERITGVHRDTIMRLGVRVGRGCAMLLDSKMQDLGCRYLQFDELWGFIGKKERHLRVDDNPELGDVWTFCAVDAETKLVPAFKVGKRNHATADAFVHDVASRMRNRVQISTDALSAYVEAVERSFGADVDYGQIVKVYVHDAAQHPERKYSAPDFASAVRRPIVGDPDMELVSTSYVERLNATTRHHVKRLARLTLAFSKKLENFEAAVALHFAYYNLVKRHNTLRCTPAMAAGVERDFWSVGQLIEAAA